MEQHRKITPGNGAVRLNAALVVNGQLLKIRVNLNPTQPKFQHAVQFFLKSVHTGVDRAKGKITVMPPDGFSQKRIGVPNLTGIRRGVGDSAAGNARKLVLRTQARHVRLALDGNAIEAADGVRRLFRQLFRENMRVDVCDLHEKSSFILYGDMPGMQSRAFRLQSKFITLFPCVQVAEKPESAWDPGKILSLS